MCVLQVVFMMDEKEQIRHLTQARYACLIRIRHYFNLSQYSGQ